MSVKILMLIAGIAALGAVAAPVSRASAGAATTACSTVCYTYDRLGRVTNVVYVVSGAVVYVTYCYDTNGNRTGQMNSTTGQPMCPPGSMAPSTQSGQLVPPANALGPRSRRSAESDVQSFAGK